MPSSWNLPDVDDRKSLVGHRLTTHVGDGCVGRSRAVDSLLSSGGRWRLDIAITSSFRRGVFSALECQLSATWDGNRHNRFVGWEGDILW